MTNWGLLNIITSTNNYLHNKCRKLYANRSACNNDNVTFSDTKGLYVDSTNVWVSDFKHSIQKFNKDSKLFKYIEIILNPY